MLNIKRVKKEEIEGIKKIDKVVDKNSNEQINSLVDMLIENVQRQTQLQKLFDNTGKAKKEVVKSRNEILEYVESVLKTREIEKALIEPVKKDLLIICGAFIFYKSTLMPVIYSILSVTSIITFA